MVDPYRARRQFERLLTTSRPLHKAEPIEKGQHIATIVYDMEDESAHVIRENPHSMTLPTQIEVT